jgi:hypothetical protein
VPVVLIVILALGAVKLIALPLEPPLLVKVKALPLVAVTAPPPVYT